MGERSVERYYLLDILRGLAAIAVVLRHYQYFYFVGTQLPNDFDKSILPFYKLLWPVYCFSLSAVFVFFVLSGFVFFSQYTVSIANKKIGLLQFSVWRFSRLYPLHFVTLLLVAVGQIVSQRIDGEFVAYKYNGKWHFAQNLLLASHWGPDPSLSFNGPVWSVSIEILLYAAFFVFALMLARMPFALRVLGIISAMAIGAIISFNTHFMLIGQGVYCFFAGGLAQIVVSALQRQKISSDPGAVGFRPRSILALRSGATLASTLVRFATDFSWLVAIALAIIIVTLLQESWFLTFGLIWPAIIGLLAITQHRTSRAGRGLRSIGDLSYSIYLCHFPLQLGILVTLKAIGTTIDFGAPTAFFGFFTILFAAAVISHYWFEIPLQEVIRVRFLKLSAARDPQMDFRPSFPPIPAPSLRANTQR